MLKRKDITDYSLLAIPLAFVGLPLYIHAPDFYVAQYGLSLSTLAGILLALRIFDAVQDPIIGALSDTYSKHRFEFMFVSLIFLALGFFALFTPLVNHVAGWFVLSMLLATTAFSILTVNLNALGALWSAEPEQQTRITTTREAMALIGLTIAVITPSLLQQWLSPSSSFKWMSVILILFIIAGFWRFYGWYKRKKLSPTKPIKQRQSYWQNIKKSSTSMRRFYAIYAVSMLASAMPAVLVLFFIRDRLGLEEYTGLFLLVYFASGIAAMPFWKSFSKNYSSECAWLISMIVAVISFIGAFLLNAGDFIPYLLICIASGFSLGADLALPPAILAKLMHQDKTHKIASSQFALLTFISKTALAFAGIITLPILDTMGFVAATSNSTKALFGLSLTYALIPCIIKLIAALMLWHTMNQGETNEENNLNRNHNRSEHSA